jgi:hypothetical protein
MRNREEVVSAVGVLSRSGSFLPSSAAPVSLRGSVLTSLRPRACSQKRNNVPNSNHPKLRVRSSACRSETSGDGLPFPPLPGNRRRGIDRPLRSPKQCLRSPNRRTARGPAPPGLRLPGAAGDARRSFGGAPQPPPAPVAPPARAPAGTRSDRPRPLSPANLGHSWIAFHRRTPSRHLVYGATHRIWKWAAAGSVHIRSPVHRDQRMDVPRLHHCDRERQPQGRTCP